MITLLICLYVLSSLFIAIELMHHTGVFQGSLRDRYTLMSILEALVTGFFGFPMMLILVLVFLVGIVAALAFPIAVIVGIIWVLVTTF
jgi:hypothetical protein